MKNYTTRTAALKATTIDTRILDTKILKVNGESLEDVILQTSPKGINNAVRISTNIGSIKDKSVNNGIFSMRLTNGTLYLEHVDSISSDMWYPVQLTIGGYSVYNKLENAIVEWYYDLWEDGDNLRELYGGINDDTMIEVLIIIPEQ